MFEIVSPSEIDGFIDIYWDLVLNEASDPAGGQDCRAFASTSGWSRSQN